ncbi:MAG TPA: hypothetical protein PK397_13765 [Ignavibacteriaceae bacterium]|nr:hypothetical protein [Ignavibacteriaceae bacterium]
MKKEDQKVLMIKGCPESFIRSLQDPSEMASPSGWINCSNLTSGFFEEFFENHILFMWLSNGQDTFADSFGKAFIFFVLSYPSAKADGNIILSVSLYSRSLFRRMALPSERINKTE